MPDQARADANVNVRATGGIDRPGLFEQLSYVGGEFASNFAWNMVAGYLLF